MSVAYNLIESWNSYANISSATIGMESRWLQTDSSTLSNSTLITGRYGGQGVRMEPDSNSNDEDADFWRRATNIAGADFALHMGFIVHNTGIDSRNAQIQIGEGSTMHVGIRLLRDGTIQVYRGPSTTGVGTLLAESDAGQYVAGQWNTLQVRGQIHDSAGFVHVIVNGDITSPALSATGLDTRNGGASGIASHIQLGAQMNSNTAILPRTDFDDLLMLDSSGSFIPERKITSLQPTADTAQADLTPSVGGDNYAVVDGDTADATDYVYGSTVSDADEYECSDLPAPPESIDCINIIGYATKTDIATRAIAIGVDSNGTDDDSADNYLAESIGQFNYTIPDDPDTAGDWSYAAVNAMLLRASITV